MTLMQAQAHDGPSTHLRMPFDFSCVRNYQWGQPARAGLVSKNVFRAINQKRMWIAAFLEQEAVRSNPFLIMRARRVGFAGAALREYRRGCSMRSQLHRYCELG